MVSLRPLLRSSARDRRPCCRHPRDNLCPGLRPVPVVISRFRNWTSRYAATARSWKGSASRTERRFFVGASSAAMFVESRRKGNAAQPLLRVCYPQDAEQEGVLQRHIPDALIAPAHAAMTRAKVGLEQQQVAVGLVA